MEINEEIQKIKNELSNLYNIDEKLIQILEDFCSRIELMECSIRDIKERLSYSERSRYKSMGDI